MKKILLLLIMASAGVYAQADVKFSAKISNRNSDTLTISGKNFTKKVPINKKGVFETTFNAPKGFYQMFDGAEYAQLYLADKFDLAMTMDAKQFDESISFKGKGEKENNFLAWQTLEDEKLETLMEADEATFKAGVAAYSKNIADKLADTSMDLDFRNKMELGTKNASMGLLRGYYQAQAQKKLTGNLSPDFDYENHKGGKTKLSDLKGKYVYIDTWATWCGPCRAEIPHLQKVEQKYEGKNIEFVSISIDEKKDYEKWRKMVDEKKLGGIQLIADENWNSKFCHDYGINSIPRFILIDPQGKVVDANAPRPSQPELTATLDKLLNAN